MRLNGTAVRARHQPGPVSPVISGEDGWLGDDGRDQPRTLQLRLPVSAEELTAALYVDDHLSPADLATDENVWALAAVAIVRDGLNAIQHRAGEILVAEAPGRLASPARLELWRRRAELGHRLGGRAMAVTREQLLADPHSGARPLSCGEQAERARNAEVAAQWFRATSPFWAPLRGPGQPCRGAGGHAPRRVAHPPAPLPGPARART